MSSERDWGTGLRTGTRTSTSTTSNSTDSGTASTDTGTRPPYRYQAFGLRLGLWYATLFVTGAIAIVFATYFLTSASLAQRDRQVINAKVGEYAALYNSGGIASLADTVRAEQQTAPERLFVRVVDRGTEALVLSMPDGWNPATLDTATLRMADGTIVQVGKSTDTRDDLLSRFRAALGLVTLLVVVLALTGGLIATRTAVLPIRRLTQAVRRIIRTGRTDARVPLAGTDDALDELTVLFNAMLDKIEGLVTGMRGALDNASHDLRTPLTRLRGSAEIALAGPSDVERYREALADCVEEADRVLVMLNTLMDISEAESGAMQLARERVELADVARRAVDLYKDVAEAKRVSLDLRLNTETTAVYADRTRLEQVAANLIDNAVKYTPEDGTVEVEVTGDGRDVVLRVRDTGPGVPPDELPRIWDRLFRGDRSRSERGLGLGLSLVKAVVEAHGGTVHVKSDVGKGAVFEVWLKSGNLSSM